MAYPCKNCKKAINNAFQILFLEEKNPDMTAQECAEMIAYDKGWTCSSRGLECPDEEGEQ
tara:strand:- start:1256 stop:1435 length:180 start_codon:yes stop_codon:yes gene_type:complete